MSWNIFRRDKKSQPPVQPRAEYDLRRGELLPISDTKAAIDELAHVVRNNSEVVEIYLALGSLYRSQGEIERAIQIRNNLIVRPGLNPRFKARAYYELGRDFRRAGFLDRAAHSFEKAREFGGEPEAITLEEAKLAAQRADHAQAAELYGRLGRHLPQAHYLVRQAQETFESGDDSQGQKLLKQAIRAYPASVEAWLERLCQARTTPEDFGKILSQGMAAVEPDLRFVLLEGLMESAQSCDQEEDAQCHGHSLDPDLGQSVVAALEALEPDPLLYYQAAKILMLTGDLHMARSWFERTLVMDSQFWLARLELFGLSLDDQEVSPFLAEQLDYFIKLAHQVKRFVCNRCGLRRDRLFSLCPRCHSWHSIAFRARLGQ